MNHKIVFVLNALLTLSFGVPAYFVPAEVFTTFGLTLDAGGQVVTRGYAITCVGYGLAMLAVRGVTEIAVVRGLLLATVVFNLGEVILQTQAGLAGTVGAMVWGTCASHAALGLLGFVQILRTKKNGG